jgi:hypothetical protein
MSKNHAYRRHYRSFFWPIIFLGAGVIWLLTNMGIIPNENLWVLIRLWPVLIIIAGIDILFARRLALIGALLGLLAITGVIYILLMGDTLGIETAPQPRTETFNAELGDTETAAIDLNLSIQGSNIHALSDSGDLILAKIGHIGEIEFTVTGTTDKHIKLSQIGIEGWYNWFLPTIQGENLRWDIGLSPDVPLDLSVDASTGKSDLDLSGIELEQFQYDASTGASTIILPASAEEYKTQLEASTGAMTVVLPEESNLTVRLDGSTGKVTFDVPDGAAIKIEVRNGGTGNLLLPSWITKVEGLADRDEGTYQTEGFDSAEYQLLIVIDDISTGNIAFE